MPPDEKPEPVTPVDRRLLRTSVPGVYKRGTRFVAITQYRGTRIKTSHRTKAEARRAKAERTARPRALCRERFESYAERWLVEYTGRTARGLAPSTREAYAWSMHAYVIPYFRGVRMSDIGPADVKRFIAYLAGLAPRRSQRGAQRLAASTVRRILTPLKAMLAEAYELELIRSDAARVRIVIPGERQAKAVKTLSATQIRAVREHVGERDRLLVFLLSRTGVRISEALGLRWRDLRATPEGYVLSVRRQCSDGEERDETKTLAGMRDVAVVPALARALLTARRAASFDGPDDPIFPSHAGTHQDDHNIRRRLRPAIAAAGAEGATPHTFRHSLATELLSRGHDSSEIAKILGHRSEAFTRRVYIHAPEVPRFDEIDP